MTLATLKQDLLAVLGTVEAEQQIPAAVRLAEAEMSRRVRCRQMVGRAEIDISAAYETLPADFGGIRSLELGSNPSVTLEYVEPDRLSALKGIHTASGAPIYYSILGAELRLVPTPNTSYPASQLTYWKTIPALTADGSTNWLLDAWPDAYLYGALKHLGRILNDGRVGTLEAPGWAAAFDVIVKEMNASIAFDEGRPK